MVGPAVEAVIPQAAILRSLASGQRTEADSIVGLKALCFEYNVGMRECLSLDGVPLSSSGSVASAIALQLRAPFVGTPAVSKASLQDPVIRLVALSISSDVRPEQFDLPNE